MRGRKPDATAVRRGEKALMVKPAVNLGAQAGGAAHMQGCEKPKDIAANDVLSGIWDATVGSGAAFEPCDVPFLRQFVVDIALAEECQRHLFDEFGTPKPMLTSIDEEGNVSMRPNPYSKAMREAVSEALKLADELGLTRFARTRLGLAEAAGASISLTIAEQIDRALARGGK